MIAAFFSPLLDINAIIVIFPVIAVGIVFLVFFFRIRIETKQRKRLERLVTERTAELKAAMDRVEAANKAKSEFLSHMSHELRTPLNGILGYSQILLTEGGLNSEQTDGLNIIQNNGEHLLMLINDILDLSKIEAGKVLLSNSIINFIEFLDDISALIRARAEEKGLDFSSAYLAVLPVYIRIDEKRLRQILLNLLGNAVKFTDTGHVILKVYLLEMLEGIARIRFEIMDTGPGINPRQLDDIFLPFVQSGDIRHYSEGTGLGLAISRRLVAEFGGKLAAESVTGSGSTFRFDLNIPASDDFPVLSDDEGFSVHGDGKSSILVADDNDVDRNELVGLLKPLGFDVFTADNGREEIEKAIEIMPDLILTDLVMKGISGFDAVQEIRKIPVLKNIPVIAVTDSVPEMDLQDSKLAGCDNFLSKPVNPGKLFELIRMYLGIDWLTFGPVGKQPASGRKPAGCFAAPPAEELGLLLEMLDQGDIRKIRKRASEIGYKDIRYKPFMEELLSLARAYEVKKLRLFINSHLGVDK